MNEYLRFAESYRINDTGYYNIAMAAHNELVRRSNEKSSIWSKKVSYVSVGLAFATIILAWFTIKYSMADVESDEVWQDRQLELLEKIKSNIQTTKAQ